MNCRTSQFELSQCLDGRLASGRRAAVMEHVATCSICAHFWGELQQAQSQVLRLPQQRVSESFRAGLFQRIESGEGTPEAVFHEPIPLATKVRYVLTGAAAAAAVLVAASFMRSKDPQPESPGVVAQVAVQQAPDTDANGPQPVPVPPPQTGLRPRDSQPGLPDQGYAPNTFQQLAPATPGMFATEAARHFQNGFDAASLQARSFASKPNANLARSLCSNALEMKQFGSLLLYLRDRDHLYFGEAAVGDELRDLVVALDSDELRQQHYDAAARQVVVPALGRVGNLRRLQRTLYIRPEPSPMEQMQAVWRLFEERRDTLKQMFVFFPGADLDPLLLPAPGQAFSLANDCGQVLVIARRP